MNRRQKQKKQAKGARWENQVRALSWTPNHMIQAVTRSRKCDFLWTVEEGGRLGRKGRQSRKEKFHDITRTRLARPVLYLMSGPSFVPQMWYFLQLIWTVSRRAGPESRGREERKRAGKFRHKLTTVMTVRSGTGIRTGTCSDACVWRNVAVSTRYSLSGFETWGFNVTFASAAFLF